MDVNTLKEMVDTANDTQENVVKFLLNCLYVYVDGKDDDAMGYLGYVLSKNDCVEDMNAASGLVPRLSWQQLMKDARGKPNCIISSMGASWEKDYKDLDPDDYKLPVVRKDELGGHNRLFIQPGGRDNPIPISMKQNSKGQWKVTKGFSTLLMDVRKPKSEVDDF